MIGEETQQRIEDAKWKEYQIDRAKAARDTIHRAIRNLSVTAGEMVELVGKCNAGAIDRFPAWQLKLIGFTFGWNPDTQCQAFVAKLEYSPLGWPDEEKPLKLADIGVLFEDSASPSE